MSRSVINHLAALVVAVAGCGIPTSVAGQETTDNRLEDLSEEEQLRAVELLDEGEQAYDAGDFEQAIESFSEVHEIVPHPNVSYQLAETYEALGNYEMAIQHYRRYLDEMPDAEDRGRIERIIEEHQRRLGDELSTVRVETDPEGAEIFLESPDSVPVGTSPEKVTLQPGTHRLFVGFDSRETIALRTTTTRARTPTVPIRMPATVSTRTPPTTAEMRTTSTLQTPTTTRDKTTTRR